VNFSRFGGLGQHRTPIGFSGDTARKWDTLAYQTYFTPHAANVGFGWWSHDIGGFSASPVDDVFHTSGPELYLRCESADRPTVLSVARCRLSPLSHAPPTDCICLCARHASHVAHILIIQ
jgi:hypothetical protein